jgi:glycerol-3-phosphate dehydrogenase
MADIVHAVRAEWAMTLGDVLLRRTAIGLAACQGLDRLDAIADVVGGLLAWDPARQAAEVAAYRQEIAPMRRFSTT